MKRNKDFHDYVVFDLLGDIDGITSRGMFSGFGIYKDGVIFAIIIGDELYLKTNDDSRKYFEENGSRPFSFSKKDGKVYTTKYWLVPEEIFDNREEFKVWLDLVVDGVQK